MAAIASTEIASTELAEPKAPIGGSGPGCVLGASPRPSLATLSRSEAGQTTAEYALVLIAAATIAMLIVAWASNTGAISQFFDTIIERITQMLP